MSVSRCVVAILPAFLAVLALGSGAAAAPAVRQSITRPGDAIVISIPQFVANAVSFKALDETGWDWTGSDEVHAAFVDFSYADEHVTSVYEDVDSGETKTFRPEDQCMAPQPGCNHGAKSLHFAVALWESDWTPSAAITGCKPHLINTHDSYEHGICQGDDLIGRAEISLSGAQLLTMLPNVGQSVDVSVKPTGGSGSYQFTYRVTRRPNVERNIVIHQPTDPQISLQASLDNPPSARRVILTWSGATAGSVDILRGAALIATTANDGQYVDHVPTAGTYQYRVCDVGTTFCSATATVTVP